MKKTLKRSSRSCWWSHLWFPTEDHIRLISQKSKHLLFLIVSIAVVIPTRLKLGVKILRCVSTKFVFFSFLFLFLRRRRNGDDYFPFLSPVFFSLYLFKIEK